MANIDISARIIGDTELSAALARLSSHDIPKAIKAGVRDAARAGRTTLAKSISQRYSLSSGRVKQDVPTARFMAGGQTAVITTSRKPITAMEFKPKQTRAGLSMSQYRGERTLIKSGFMQFSKAGKFKGNLPFKPDSSKPYKGDVGKRKKPRAFLDVIHGPSIHAIYTGGKWSPALQARTEVRIEDALENGIIRALGGMGRGFGRA